MIEVIEGIYYPAIGFQVHPEALITRAIASGPYDLPRLIRLFHVLPTIWGCPSSK